MKVWYCIGSPLKDGRLILGAWSTPISVSRLLVVFSPALLARLLSLTGSRPLTVSLRLGVSKRGLRGCRLTECIGRGSMYTSCAWVLDPLCGVPSRSEPVAVRCGGPEGGLELGHSVVVVVGSRRSGWIDMDAWHLQWVGWSSNSPREGHVLTKGWGGRLCPYPGSHGRTLSINSPVILGGCWRIRATHQTQFFWGAGLSFLLDRWVKLGSSHCRGAVYVFSLCGAAGLDLPSTGRLILIQSFRTLRSIFSQAGRLGSVQSFGSLHSIFSLDGDLRLIHSSAGRLGWRDCSPAQVVSA